MGESQPLADIQKLPPELPVPIDRVGVRGLRVQLSLKDRERGIQTTMASVDLGVNLDHCHKGTHMSRFVETLNTWREVLGYQSMFSLLSTLREKLDSSRAWACFSFPYIVMKKAPSGAGAHMAYDCAISGELINNELSFLVKLEVPVMTVCPCSLAISDTGAHSQRALIRMRLAMTRFVWLEDLIAIAETSGSSPVFPLLKRTDEKAVTENAFTNPVFVEDVARRTASQLADCPDVLDFEVDVESMESIHNHNAFACISKKAFLSQTIP